MPVFELRGGAPSKGTPADQRKQGRGRKPGPKPKRKSKPKRKR